MLPLRLPLASSRGLSAAVAALLWALAVGSVVFWWLHSPQHDARPNHPVGEASTASTSNSTAVARALGQASVSVAAPDAQRRFQLLGVIADQHGQGSALLAVDGQPAKAYLVGQEVADGWRTASLSRYGVTLRSPEAGALQLEITGHKAGK